MSTQPPTNPQTTVQPPDSNHPPGHQTNSPDPNPSSSPHLAPNLLPKGRTSKKRGKWAIALLVLLTLGSTGFAGWYFLVRKQVSHAQLMLHTIKKDKFQITIMDRGTVQPADNIYIPCKVKAKTPGQASTSIRWVIDNGAPVKEGDRIMVLDDSALKDQLNSQQVVVYQAEQAWQQAELTRLMNKSTNQTDVNMKVTALKVAEIAKQEYLEGLYIQTKLDLQNKLDMSRSDLFMWEERAVWSDRMSRPGKQYVTVSQAEADESRRKTAELTVQNYTKQVEVLDKLTKEKNSIQLGGAIEDAKSNLETSKQKLEKQLKLDDVAVKSTLAQYQTQLAKLSDLQQDIDDCLIRAPRDGMVVYYVEERARFNSNQGVIGQGELVKEGQKLVAVPDLSKLVIDARIHEAMVPRVIADNEVSTGASKVIQGVQLFSPNPLTGLPTYIGFDEKGNPEAIKAFADANPQLEKRLEKRGMDAVVVPNAFTDRELTAHVKWVSPVASQTDWFSSDVKVYQTFIAVDDSRTGGLKPGMDATVTIYVDVTPEPVLVIPLQALVGGVDMGEKRLCYVMVDGSPVIREITLAKGKANDKVAQIEAGLQGGDVVVLNPSALLSDKQKADYGVQSGSSSQSGKGGPGAWGDKGGRKGKGKGGKQGGPGGGGEGGPGGGAQGGGRRGGAVGGGARGQGGAAPGAKTAASP